MRWNKKKRRIGQTGKSDEASAWLMMSTCHVTALRKDHGVTGDQQN